MRRVPYFGTGHRRALLCDLQALKYRLKAEHLLQSCVHELHEVQVPGTRALLCNVQLPEVHVAGTHGRLGLGGVTLYRKAQQALGYGAFCGNDNGTSRLYRRTINQRHVRVSPAGSRRNHSLHLSTCPPVRDMRYLSRVILCMGQHAPLLSGPLTLRQKKEGHSSKFKLIQDRATTETC